MESNHHSDACFYGGKRRAYTTSCAQSAEGDLLYAGEDDFFSIWNHDVMGRGGMQSPDPTAVVGASLTAQEADETLALFASDNNNNNGPHNNEDRNAFSNFGCRNHEFRGDDYYYQNGGGGATAAGAAVGALENHFSHGWPPPPMDASLQESPIHAPPEHPVNHGSSHPPPHESDHEDTTEHGAAGAAAAARRRKKPKSKCGPQRPLSAYNLFFRDYRRCLMQQTGGSVPFVTMGKEVGKKWKTLDKRERREWETKAEQESIRYRKELRAYKEHKRKKQRLQISGLQELYGRPHSSEDPDEPLINCEPEDQIREGEEFRDIDSQDEFVFRRELFNPNNGALVHSLTTTAAAAAGQEDDSNPLPLSMAAAGHGTTSAALQGAIDLAGAAAAQTPFSKAREVLEFPEGFVFPEGLPPTGTEIYLADSSGTLRPHMLCWKLYALAASDAGEFMAQFKQGEGVSSAMFS
ncbi:hypothetical protein ACA910_015636 [Epithemia clementina (nom. ined.)]